MDKKHKAKKKETDLTGKITLTSQERKYISKKMSYALRHNPGKYGLDLDSDGSIALPVFLKALNNMHHFQPELTEERVREVMDKSDKQRFEISQGRIRALYGHSFSRQVEKTEAVPPDILYHGTARRFLDSIMDKGLLPMGRQYVHLSADTATARQVGRRRDHEPVILVIEAGRAHRQGLAFYLGNDQVWLADRIPPEYIRF